MNLFDMFDLPSEKSDVQSDKALIQKKSKPRSSTMTLKGSGSIIEKIQSIVSIVASKFEKNKDKVLLIQTEQELSEYIDACIKTGVVSIDTETTGLDPILDDIVGFSIYTTEMKAAYIPINHISYITKRRCDGQMPIDAVRRQFQRLVDANVKTYWFNAPFDVRVIGNHIGVWFTPYFDGSVAIRVLNSAEPQGQIKLKVLYKKYCGNAEDEALTFSKLFDNVPFNLIPIMTAYLYGAMDALYTFEFCDYLAQFLEPTGEYYEEYNMKDLSYVFFEIEMKSMPVFISMEEDGIAIDFEYAEELSEKYHGLYSKMEDNLWAVFEDYRGVVEEYKLRNPSCKLTDPVNFNSPTQLQIIIYDVLKLPVIDRKKPRSTEADVLAQMKHPLCDAIADYKKFVKLINTYIDKLPEEAQEYQDKRIHCHFLQVGAETGRVACKSPKMIANWASKIRLIHGRALA